MDEITPDNSKAIFTAASLHIAPVCAGLPGTPGTRCCWKYTNFVTVGTHSLVDHTAPVKTAGAPVNMVTIRIRINSSKIASE